MKRLKFSRLFFGVDQVSYGKPVTSRQRWKSVTVEKSLPLLHLLRLWEEHDRLSTFMEKNPEGLLDEFMGLRSRVVTVLRTALV